VLIRDSSGTLGSPAAFFERLIDDLARSEAIKLERWQRRTLDLRAKALPARLWACWS
jgi:hypothetical protein